MCFLLLILIKYPQVELKLGHIHQRLCRQEIVFLNSVSDAKSDTRYDMHLKLATQHLDKALAVAKTHATADPALLFSTLLSATDLYAPVPSKGFKPKQFDTLLSSATQCAESIQSIATCHTLDVDADLVMKALADVQRRFYIACCEATKAAQAGALPSLKKKVPVLSAIIDPRSSPRRDVSASLEDLCQECAKFSTQLFSLGDRLRGLK
jgi:hypothetical protein